MTSGRRRAIRRDDWADGGNHADDREDRASLTPIGADLRVRACVGSAKSTMGDEARVRRHNISPQRR